MPYQSGIDSYTYGINPKYTKVQFQNAPNVELRAGGAPSLTAGNINVMCANNGYLFQQYNITNIGSAAPVPGGALNSGIDFSPLANAANTGVEFCESNSANSKSNFTVNAGALAPYVQSSFRVVTDNLVNELIIGYRVAAGYQAALGSYTDFATIGIVGTNSPAKIQIQTRLASGAVTTTDTTNTWASAATVTLRLNISASGVVTYLINGAAPVVTAAYTFGSGNNIIPFIRYQTSAGGSGPASWITYECGPQ